MAAAAAGDAPPHRGLPDEIAIWEILVRLPPKSLLRCRTVCRAWRRATSHRSFLLAHHAHQPALPILYDYCFDNTLAAVRPVARLGFRDTDTDMRLEASCDGLLLLSTEGGAPYFSVCNPATRQYAPLQLPRGFSVGGMYPHHPTGEYRLLLYPDAMVRRDQRHPGTQDACHVYTVGSCHPPRHIGRPEAGELIQAEELEAVLFRGNLHWYIELQGEIPMIVVFDTTAELFRKMRAPAVPDAADLFEMDGMLGIASFNDAAKTIGIWMTQDYNGKVWAFKYRVQLPVAELTGVSGCHFYSYTVVLSGDDNDLLILVRSGNDSLLQIDSGGKLVARFDKTFLGTTQFRLKQSLVQHTFFPAVEGYVVNTWPFISPDD